MKGLQCSSQEKETNPSQKMVGINSGNTGTTELQFPISAFSKGAQWEKKRKNNIYRCAQISDPLYTIWPQKAAKAAREASKPHQEEAVRAGGQAEPPPAACGQASLQVPVPAMPWQPWACCPQAQPKQRPCHGTRNRVTEGQQKGTLIFVFVNPCLLLQPDLVPKGSQHQAWQSAVTED